MSGHSSGRLVKGEGSYYTPPHIAGLILDIAGYVPGNPAILDSDIIDPAAGDGALLVEAARRYLSAAAAAGLDGAEAAAGIAGRFHAIELDAGELSKCKDNVCMACREAGVGISPADLSNFACGDALELHRGLAGRFGFVVGNPPYVRIHNLGSKPDSPYVDGMCDLFYPFFDIGQRLLAPGTGALCYIAPSSWFGSSAGRKMRADLEARSVIREVCDFGHFQVFAPHATAYTAIVKIGAAPSGTIRMDEVDFETGRVVSAREMAAGKCWVGGGFFPGAPGWLGDVMSWARGDIRVRNGYATNLDRVYMSKARRFPGSPLELPAVKASRCEGRWMVYPYDEDGNLLPFDEVESASPGVAGLLSSNRDALLARTQVDAGRWWAFARSQGITDTFSDKVAVQSLVKPGEEVRCMEAPAGTGVYGGVYVMGMGMNEVHEAMNSKEMGAYAAALRKYKSGGYYALGGKDLERFLNWYRESFG